MSGRWMMYSEMISFARSKRAITIDCATSIPLIPARMLMQLDEKMHVEAM